MSATAKLFLFETGRTIGTIGGGCLEAEVIARAGAVLAMASPQRSVHSLNAELAGDYGLTCGGTAEILIEPVFPDAGLCAVYEAAARVVATGARGAMATALDWSAGPAKRFVTAQGSVGSAAPALVRALDAFDPLAEEPMLTDDLLLEPVVGRASLIVFGAGHVGARIAQVASLAQWRVTLLDDRAEFADPARHSGVDRVAVCDFHDIASAVAIDAESWVVIATRGHQHDALIASQVAPRRPRYLGMLGSRRKGALTAQALAGWGVAADDTARIRTPVGMPIGADTPEEIAVSVVAEMIAVRRGRA